MSCVNIRSEMKKERVLVLVKTYPSPSKKYIETVCTAGLREDGSWIRIFPVPYRVNGIVQPFSKYQWIECNVDKTDPSKDGRPESHHLEGQIKILGQPIPTTENWELRRRAVLDKARVFTNIKSLISAAKANERTLAIFKPATITLRCVKAAKVPDERIVRAAQIEAHQLDLFESNDWRDNFKFAEHIPYDFKYEVTDDEGATATWKILDWELGALFYGTKESTGDIEKAKEDVIKKYDKDFLSNKKDLYLYLGTINGSQKRNWPNPWTIIGVAPFPKVSARPQELF